jgi:murein DD-endopeptidase MepM/ murein hydrolase activator NlpD
MARKVHPFLIAAAALLVAAAAAQAQLFQFPTANRTLLEKDGGAKFFTGTIGNNWPAGAYGCVRNSGWRMHEGVDIQCLERDKKDEPVDPVLATADGAVVYINKNSWASAYGIYVVVRHEIESLAVYSIYAHLRRVESGLRVGQSVAAGQRIGTLGRSANHAISKKRAHLHFELTLILNDQYDSWRRKTQRGTKNEHGKFNGINLAGFDPAEVLLRCHTKGGRPFSLLQHLRGLKPLYRVVVRDASFPWLKRYPRLIKRNPAAEREGVAGYEIHVDFAGLPFLMIPRAESELTSKSRIQLLDVDAEEYQKGHCRQHVEKKGKGWALTRRGTEFLELLTY